MEEQQWGVSLFSSLYRTARLVVPPLPTSGHTCSSGKSCFLACNEHLRFSPAQHPLRSFQATWSSCESGDSTLLHCTSFRWNCPANPWLSDGRITPAWPIRTSEGKALVGSDKSWSRWLLLGQLDICF